ncbi:MAG: hypothetical protein E7168_04255 [Firmicutes bacterium]|nr:hypothetical protein [Bacillota bacterium]
MLENLEIKSIRIGLDEYIQVLEGAKSWDDNNYLQLENNDVFKYTLQHKIYTLYRNNELIGLATIFVEGVPHYYLGIDKKTELFPIKLRLIIKKEYRNFGYGNYFFDKIKKIIDENYIYSDLKIQFPSILNNETQRSKQLKKERIYA